MNLYCIYSSRAEFKPLVNNIYKLILTIHKIKSDNGNYLSIDLGINNLTGFYSNKTKESFIIDDGQYLSISRYFNKEINHFQSILKFTGGKA